MKKEFRNEQMIKILEEFCPTCGKRKMSFAEIAKQFNVTRQRVHVIYNNHKRFNGKNT